jgi:alkanesulfonate monooxygenase SsuD/methylene tetrahydromethanopterin reductase-like flavin-dependent oxidoreductase (luciferase family)
MFNIDTSNPLTDWTQANGLPAPLYQEYALAAHFGCEVTLQQLPQRTEPLGNRAAGFASKKAARGNAAREAVLWLRSQHLLDSSSSGGGGGGATPRKKQKRASTSNAADPAQQTNPATTTTTAAAAASSSSIKLVNGTSPSPPSHPH